MFSQICHLCISIAMVMNVDPSQITRRLGQLNLNLNVSDNSEAWSACRLWNSTWGLSLLPQAATFTTFNIEWEWILNAKISSNVLHSSGPNTSLDRRWNLVLAYNQVLLQSCHTNFSIKDIFSLIDKSVEYLSGELVESIAVTTVLTGGRRGAGRGC